MAFVRPLCCILVFVVCSAHCFTNPYPRYKKYEDNGDPGEPLYLTELIKLKRFEEAKRLAKVDDAAMNQIAPSYAGYFTVNEKYSGNMFFWYFPAAIRPDDAPVVLWLQGGPGASSLFGLFTENGPFVVDANQTVSARKYSWHVNHHLIYIDNPVGTGFSFTNEEGYVKNEKEVGENLYEVLRQFFTLFSELQSHEFYITGESYAGKYVPALGHTIFRKSQIPTELPKINLVGLAIGNGLSDPQHQLLYGAYLYQLGLIDTNGHDLFVELEAKGVACIRKQDFECAFDVFDELINMDESPNGSVFKNLTGFPTYFNYINPAVGANDAAMGKFLQSSTTRRAIHVGNNSFHDLVGENKVEEHLKKDVMDSVAVWVSELLSHYKVLIYNGQLDIIVAYPLTENYLKKLKFNGDSDYKTAKRMIWHVDNEVAGYVKHAGNLTEVMVRNAGHMVPADQPKWALDLILRMTSKKGFPPRVLRV